MKIDLQRTIIYLVYFGADYYVLKWFYICILMYQAVLETVARVSKKNETKEEKYVLSLVKDRFY